jgi:hypothetical protein
MKSYNEIEKEFIKEPRGRHITWLYNSIKTLLYKKGSMTMAS